ncbi:DUF7507 domain-containing protein [Prescottella agglutinans]|uniref:DUF7507 domain-containing protein n=1 Tax=Prescottella agglutinans TaxID=1644129 RepID=UPI002474D8C6|nr:hypothetical protein [Prescottella agglutinans]
MATVSTATVGAGTAAAAGNLRCDVLYSVDNNAGKAKQIDPATGVATDAFDVLPSGNTRHNQLGIGPGGAYAIYTSGDGKIYKYDAAKAKTDSTDRDKNVKVDTHGAINPANGLYYYGGKDDGADSFTFGAYDPVQNKSLGVVLKVTLEKGVKLPGGNGDMAFDAQGNLFIVAAGDSKGRIYSVQGPMPTSSLKTLTGKAVTDESSAFKLSNSIAFGPNGFLFVGGGGSLLKVDPGTGKEVSSNLKNSSMTDMGSCNDPNTITLQKNLPAGRVGKDDQFGLEISGGGLSEGNKATTTGTKTGIQDQAAGPVLGLAGTKYAIKETAQNGASLDNYVTTWECVDAKAPGTKLGSGSGTSGEVTLPAGQSGKSISCTFTNAAKKSGLDLVKSVSPDGNYKVGDVVTYTFKMTNSGAVPLTDVHPNEIKFSAGLGKISAFDCPDRGKPLAPGASAQCTAKYTVLQSDVDRGFIDNTATATGTDPGNSSVVSKESSAKLVGNEATHGIKIEKTASPKEAASYKVGQTIKYSFKITNTGNVTLKNVTAKEGTFTGADKDKLSKISCPETAAALAPNADVTCTAEYTLTQADIDKGWIENTATATGTPPGKDKPIESDPDTEKVEGNPAKSLSIVKDASPSSTETYKVGQEIEYTFLIKNTGDVTLTGVHVNEVDFSGDKSKLSDVNCPADAKSLAPAASVKCTATYTLTQADIDAGKLKNIASAEGTPPGGGEPVKSDPDDKTLSGEPKPAISLEKTASPSEADQFVVDQVITYTFTITNTGNVTLKDVHPNEGDFTGDKSKLSGFNCPNGSKSLAPNESVECTATYTLTQADVDRGTLDNIATATGTPQTGDPVESKPAEAKLTGDQKPNLKIVKTASPKGAETFKVGQEITYTFDITNTGNQTLTNVKVAEGRFSGSGKIHDLSCPDDSKSMVPGAKVTCSAKYTITQEDVNEGKLDNVATATGTPPGTETPIESPQDEENLTGDPKSGLELVKTAEPTANVKAGETVTYTFAITNTGDQTLTDITVNEVKDSFTGSGTLSEVKCPDEAKSLDPGKSVTCEAKYEFTSEDVKAGSVHNVATVTGTQPSKTPIDSNESDATVTAGEQPGGTGSLGSLGTGSLGSLGAGSLGAGSLSAGSLAAGSLAAGSLGAGSLAAGSLASGSKDNAGSTGSTGPQENSGSAGSSGSQENTGSNGSGTPGGSNVPGKETDNPGTPGNPGNPGNPGTPADSQNGGNAGKSGDKGTTGNSDTETGAKIDSGLGADSDGGMNAGLVAGGLVLLIAAGGVLLFALRRRNQGNE